MSSFAEAKATKFVKTCATDFIEYNSRQLSRIYPKGTRTGSSNYDPMDYWIVGSQLGKLHYVIFNKKKRKNPILIHIFLLCVRSGS